MALAYLDQLRREKTVPVQFATEMTVALELAASFEDGARDPRLADRPDDLASTAQVLQADGMTRSRLAGLAGTLGGIAARLR